MIYVFYAVTIVVSYLLGSLSASVLLSRYVFREDIRTHGSGNAGATNMARVYGMLPGLLTLALDALKTLLACLLGIRLLGDTGFCLAGIFSMLGHCFPVFFGFKGGKGVSTTVPLAFMIDWRIGLIAAVFFFTLFFFTRIVSLCSISTVFLIAVLAVCFDLTVPKIMLAVFICIFVTARHHANIVRLLHGEEKKFSPHKKG